MAASLSLKSILTESSSVWDNADLRPVVLNNFRKVVACRTAALGAEVYRSEAGEEKIVFHTCKSPTCSTCGQKGLTNWQRQVLSTLPNVPYSGMLFTMHSDLWPIFQQNRHLLQDLPALAAGVLQDWAEVKYGALVVILGMPHSFGSRLRFKPHIHFLVSRVGISGSGRSFIKQIRFPPDAITQLWRHTVVRYLLGALETKIIDSSHSMPYLKNLIESHYDRLWWVPKEKNLTNKYRFSQYLSRYLRRPPIANHKLLSFEDGLVRFLSKEKDKTIIVEYSISEFIQRLSDHVLDRYRHGVRYFGLLAPRSKRVLYEMFLRLLGHERRAPLSRLTWSQLSWQTFRVNPLIDSAGRPFVWCGRMKARIPPRI